MKRKYKPRYKPIELHVSSPDELFSEHRYEVSKAIIKAIDHAIKKNLKKVDFAKIIIQEFIAITLQLDGAEYIETLEKNISIMEEFEEYEICAYAQSLKDKIKNSTESDKPKKKLGVNVRLKKL
jgi:hypothetical protein